MDIGHLIVLDTYSTGVTVQGPALPQVWASFCGLCHLPAKVCAN